MLLGGALLRGDDGAEHVAVEQLAGDARGENGVPGVDRAQRLVELGRAGVLEEEARRPCGQGAEGVVVLVVGGHHQRPDGGVELGDARGGVDPVEHRHAHIHEDDVGQGAPIGGQCGELVEGVLAVGGLGDDVEVIGPIDHEGQAHAGRPLVVDDHDGDDGTAWTDRAGGDRARHARAGSWNGMVTCTLQPPSGMGPAVRLPPCS